MSTTEHGGNSVRDRRLQHDWSQAELADRAGISRAAVSAIEGDRLVPSVAAALALARALDCSVEELFAPHANRSAASASWAWTGGEPAAPPMVREPVRYWSGNVQDRILFYPVEATPLGELPHDGLWPLNRAPHLAKGAGSAEMRRLAERTLVMACCDPAVGLLARIYEQVSGYRMLVFPRSSRSALSLLQQGLVHVAGVHLAAAETDDGNATSVTEILAEPSRLLRVAAWDDGIAVGSSVTAQSVRGLLRDRLTWIGREPGSGARQCLDEVLQDRAAPRRLARDHRGVAEAIRSGWADAGVCLRLVAQEAGLRFLPIRMEGYDLCFTQTVKDDPRVQALVRVVQSRDYRQLLGELPGYDSRRAGELISVE